MVSRVPLALLLACLGTSLAWRAQPTLSMAAHRQTVLQQAMAHRHRAVRHRAQPPCIAMTEPEPEKETPPAPSTVPQQENETLPAAPTQPEPMNAKDYLTFLGYIGGFVVFFYAIGALAKLVGT